MSLMTFVLLLGGLAALVVGAEALVRGAARLAAAVGLSPLVVGLTVVAYGTSAPELAVSVKASLAGQADLAIGNVVGSNIFNVLLILGLSATITPLAVARQLVRWDVWIMIGTSAAALLLGLDGRLGRLDGLLLVAGAFAYSAWSIYQGRREQLPSAPPPVQHTDDSAIKQTRPRLPLDIAFVLLGLVLLVLGAHGLVDSAVTLARALGVSELLIGLTIVAAGTSLPELATSVVAAARGQRDIAVGNVVGSNIFNVLAVLGGAAVTSPNGVNISAAALHMDLPVMVAVALMCLPVFFTGYTIARWEGLLFLACYVAYTAYLVLGALQHPALPTLRAALLWGLLPAVVLVLLGTAVWSLRPAPRKTAI